MNRLSRVYTSLLIVLGIVCAPLVGRAATTVATPTFSVAGGTYNSARSVKITDSTSGSAIYYTTDGSTPTTSSTKYTSGSVITVNATETLEAIATKSGDTSSAVAIAVYTLVTPTPTISLAAGIYSGTQPVTIQDTNSAATIYYTTDGSTPTTSSVQYTGTISVSTTETLQVIAVVAGYSPSSVASATYTVSPVAGALSVYISAPGVQSTSVTGAVTETFDAVSAGTYNSAYVSTAGIGTYTGSSTRLFAIMPPDLFGGATDSTSTTPTNYFAVGVESGSTTPVYLTLAQPASYFGFWWSAGDTNNRVALYSGSTLYGTFSTADLVKFLKNGVGTIQPLAGSPYNSSDYFYNPNLPSGSNDAGEPFAYISFTITGATIDKIAFYNTTTETGFESDNHSVIFMGNTVVIPTTFVPVENMSLSSQPVFVTISPSAATVTVGETQQFTATVTGSSNKAVTWSVSPATGAGSISTSGLYTAPSSVTTSQTVTITATSQANSAVSASASLSLKVTPTISAWPTASGIIYGQTLAGSTLSGGTASVAGSFAYSTPTATPGAGTASQSVTFTPTDATDYATVIGSVSVMVSSATPTLSWTAPAAIIYGTALSATQLNATVPVAGSFVYSPAAGTVLPAGTLTLKVVFTPTDTADYNTVVASVPLTVNQAAPIIACSPVAITYGTALSLSQLNCSSGSVIGNYVVTPATGSVLSSGTQSISVLFTPTDTTDYSTPAAINVSLPVNKASLTVTPANTARNYGVANPVFTGTFTSLVAGDNITASYTSSATATTPVGVYSTGANAISSTLSDPGNKLGNYTLMQTLGTLTITQASVTINCSPVAVTSGTPLSLTQLNCTSGGVAGS